MSAKQDLHDLVEAMPDQEAEEWLRRICAQRSDESLSYEEALGRPLVVGTTDMDRLLEMVRDWQDSQSPDDEVILAALERAEREGTGFRAREAAEW